MATEAFNKACDRLASQLDPGGHEDRRWAKEEGAKLDKVADFIQQIFADRDDLGVQPAPGIREARGFVLTIKPDHQVARLTAKLSANVITIWAVQVEGGAATISQHNNVPGSVPLDDITLETVGDALAAALNRISA